MAVAPDTHPFDLEHRPGKEPFKVADLGLAEFGRNEIRLAEQEMPGLMTLRSRYEGQAPLAGARIMGSLHMTVQTAVLIETLDLLGADVRWVSCNIFSTQDHAAAAVVVGRPETGGTPDAPARHPRLRLEGRDARGVLVVHRAGARVAGRVRPDADRRRRRRRDDAAARGPRAPRPRAACPTSTPTRSPRSGARCSACCARELASDPSRYARLTADMRGVSEETTTGVHRLYVMAEQGTLLFPAINVNDSVTKSKFDNIYGCRHSLTDGLCRATDVMLGGKLAARRRLRRGRQGLRAGAARAGRPRRRHRDRPDLRAAGGDGGLRGRAPRGRRRVGRHLHHGHGQLRRDHRRAHVAHEGQGDRRQHRPLRQRDRHGRPQAHRRHQADPDQAAVRRVGASPTATP